MIVPSIFVSGKTVAMNIAGVEAREQSTATQPAYVNAEKIAFFNAPAEMRESCPTAMRSSLFFFPVRSARKSKKPDAMRFAASAESVTGSPATPSTATPRTSLPFANAIIVFSEVIIVLPPQYRIRFIEINITAALESPQFLDEILP